jgi:hypothetical protein
MSLRVPETVYRSLMAAGEHDAMLLIRRDLDAVRYGMDTRTISAGQAKRVNRFFSDGNYNFFDSVTFR